MFPSALALWIATAPTFQNVGEVPVSCLENLRGRAGRARVELVVGVGALHESEDERGVAHLLEHLLLRPLGFDDSNGETAWDYTRYYRDVPAAADLQSVALGLVRAVRDAKFDDEAFRVEQRIVLRELEDRGVGQGSAPSDPLFGDTLLERWPGGSERSVRALEPHHARDFHKRHYHEGNLAVVIRGAVSCADLKSALEPELAAVAGGSAAEVPVVGREELGPKALPGWGDSTVVLGYFWYGATPRDEVVWRLVAAHLGRSALEDLRKARGLAYSPSAELRRRGPGGTIQLSVSTDGHSDEVAEWYDATIDALRASTTPLELLAPSVLTLRGTLEADDVRSALAELRGEPQPAQLLDSLGDVELSEALKALLVDRRAFGSALPQSNLASLVILALFGAFVLAFLGYAAVRVLRG